MCATDKSREFRFPAAGNFGRCLSGSSDKGMGIDFLYFSIRVASKRELLEVRILFVAARDDPLSRSAGEGQGIDFIEMMN